MWRWHSIAGKKAAWDAKKSQMYAKIGRVIQIAAKHWSDASMNPQLQMALQKAKYYSLPREVIDKAIKKWSWQLEWEQLQEITYEGYGPGWTAVIIKTLTSNSNRTNSNLKVIMSRW
jgi:transcriptional/translational regulatory protein YebC/TACO1